MQPEAIASGLVTAVYSRFGRKPAARLGLGDALEQRRGLACRHRVVARAACPVAQRQFPVLLTQFEGHVQLACFSRMLSLKGCSRCIHFGPPSSNRVDRTLVLTQRGPTTSSPS